MKVYGTFGAAFPRLGWAASALSRRLARLVFSLAGAPDVLSRHARQKRAALRERLDRGETVHLVGHTVSGHNSGSALVEVSARSGLRLLANDEEERFTGVKHYDGYPAYALDLLRRRLAGLGLAPPTCMPGFAGGTTLRFRRSPCGWSRSTSRPA
jgi:carbamoyltransferase